VKTRVSHLQYFVRPENMQFYRDLFAFLGWETLWDGDVSEARDGSLPMFGAGGAASVWFVGQVKPVQNDYDGPGLNHFAIGTETQADVDTTADYLRERGVELRFETPRHRPEFASGEGNTYYQVMFASPDNLLFEVVYTGPKAA
jgi:catechol 2,3-dioxygenase-like lactoylglutathione lyase family enzyme